MRHRVYGKHLGRDKDQRRALFKGLVYSLISSGTIQTSEARAKAIKGLVDKIINLAKGKQAEGRLQAYLSDDDIRERLVKEIVPKLKERTSGYTRIVKVGTRLGDQTMMVRMSLIDNEELKPIVKKSSKKTEESKEKAAAAPKKPVKAKTTQAKKGGKKA